MKRIDGIPLFLDVWDESGLGRQEISFRVDRPDPDGALVAAVRAAWQEWYANLERVARDEPPGTVGGVT